MKHDPIQIMKVIKSNCQSQGLTQAHLAKLMKVSLPTVKRWFAGNGVSVEAMLEMMSLCHLSFDDLQASLPAMEEGFFHYSKAQEEFFVLNPHHLAFFDQLLGGLTPGKIQKKFRLNDRSLRRYLRDLETQKLIEVHPRDRVRIVPTGAPRWLPGGPLDSSFGKNAVNQFVDQEWKDGLTLFLHRYSKTDRALLERGIDDLKTLAKQANRRSKIVAIQDRSFGLLIGLAAFDAEFLRDVKNLTT